MAFLIEFSSTYFSYANTKYAIYGIIYYFIVLYGQFDIDMIV